MDEYNTEYTPDRKLVVEYEYVCSSKNEREQLICALQLCARELKKIYPEFGSKIIDFLAECFVSGPSKSNLTRQMISEALGITPHELKAIMRAMQSKGKKIYPYLLENGKVDVRENHEENSA